MAIAASALAFSPSVALASSARAHRTRATSCHAIHRTRSRSVCRARERELSAVLSRFMVTSLLKVASTYASVTDGASIPKKHGAHPTTRGGASGQTPPPSSSRGAQSGTPPASGGGNPPPSGGGNPPAPLTAWVPASGGIYTPLSDAQAAADVTAEPENRPANTPENEDMPSAAALQAFYSARNNHGQTVVQANPYDAYVTGHYTGTTDEIIQWAAWKWGIPADWLRAAMAYKAAFNSSARFCSVMSR